VSINNSLASIFSRTQSCDHQACEEAAKKAIEEGTGVSGLEKEFGLKAKAGTAIHMLSLVSFTVVHLQCSLHHTESLRISMKHLSLCMCVSGMLLLLQLALTSISLPAE
jgi:hypothetical protein